MPAPVLHAKALPGNPYDGHTPATVMDAIERLTGYAIERGYVDKGYRGHDTANPRRIFIPGQRRGVFGVIKRELRRRSAIEAVISHMKTDGHLGRCHPKGQAGDAAKSASKRPTTGSERPQIMSVPHVTAISSRRLQSPNTAGHEVLQQTMSTARKILTVAFATAALAVSLLAATSSADAR